MPCKVPKPDRLLEATMTLTSRNIETWRGNDSWSVMALQRLPGGVRRSTVASTVWEYAQRGRKELIMAPLKSPRARAFRSRYQQHRKRESQHHVIGCTGWRSR